MAGIDYGTVIFKNGKRYKEHRLYPQIDDFPIEFYKNSINDNKDEIWFSSYENKYTWNVELSGIKLKVRVICDRVCKTHFSYNGDVYDVVFGYGIDNSKRVWNKIKVLYLGKKNAEKVDRVLNRLGF